MSRIHRLSFVELCHAIELEAAHKSGYIWGVRDRPLYGGMNAYAGMRSSLAPSRTPAARKTRRTSKPL